MIPATALLRQAAAVADVSPGRAGVAFALTCLLALAPAAWGAVVVDLQSPAGPGGGEPRLFSAGERLYLSWLEKVEGSAPSLRFSSWDGKSWEPPRTIASGEELIVNWADFPSLSALPDGTLVAHWMRKGPGSRWYDYDVLLSTSGDGGKAWSRPASPHRDRAAAEHGFVSVVPLDGSRFFAVWLDGRARPGGEEKGFTALYGAECGPEGCGPERLLDGTVCDCCQTAAVRTDRGLAVAYRDRTPGEIRDIYVVRREGRSWSEPSPLCRDGWKLSGCPVNGPALAARGRSVAAAWHTGASERQRVYFARSEDSGRSFGEPNRLDEGEPVGRVDAVMLDDGAAVVTWLEKRPDGAEILARRLAPGKPPGAAFTLARSSAARGSGFPKTILWRGRLVFAWTDTASKPRRVRLASMDPAELP